MHRTFTFLWTFPFLVSYTWVSAGYPQRQKQKASTGENREREEKRTRFTRECDKRRKLRDSPPSPTSSSSSSFGECAKRESIVVGRVLFWLDEATDGKEREREREHEEARRKRRGKKLTTCFVHDLDLRHPIDKDWVRDITVQCHRTRHQRVSIKAYHPPAHWAEQVLSTWTIVIRRPTT